MKSKYAGFDEKTVDSDIGVTDTLFMRESIDDTLMHDGRARTIEESILWHGGEVESLKNLFASLPVEEREALPAFLKFALFNEPVLSVA